MQLLWFFRCAEHGINLTGARPERIFDNKGILDNVS